MNLGESRAKLPKCSFALSFAENNQEACPNTFCKKNQVRFTPLFKFTDGETEPCLEV